MQTRVLNPAGRAAAARRQPASVGQLAKAAAVTALAAAAADLLVYFVGGLWGVPGEYAPVFNPVLIVTAVLVGVAAAAAGLAVLSRLTDRATTIFRIAAIVLTLLSLATPLQALAGAMPGFAAATPATGAAMIAMHLITGGAVAGLLPALARR